MNVLMKRLGQVTKPLHNLIRLIHSGFNKAIDRSREGQRQKVKGERVKDIVQKGTEDKECV